MATIPHVTVEFYGLPRERAGVSEVAVGPGSLREVLSSVTEALPRLRPLLEGGSIQLSIDGERFVEDLDEPVADGTRLLVLSADAGG
jgi:molybdopterin converting factor small subunit